MTAIVSGEMKRIEAFVRRLAATDAPVLVTGESGVGRCRVARQIHTLSRRSKQPFFVLGPGDVVCELFEAELLGFSRFGKRQVDKNVPLYQGTLFVQALESVSSSVQATLLRILEEKSFLFTGMDHPVPVDFRIVASSSDDLEAAVRQQKLKGELFFRLNVFHLRIPPLRQRTADIRAMLQGVFNCEKSGNGNPNPELTDTEWKELLSYSWPDNDRELEQFVRRWAARGHESDFKIPHDEPSKSKRSEGTASGSLSELTRRIGDKIEARIITKALHRNRWNRKKTAEMLSISYRALCDKIKRLEVSK